MKEAIKADPASHSKEDLDKAVALLKELKAKADVMPVVLVFQLALARQYRHAAMIAIFSNSTSFQDPMNALEDPVTKGKYELVRSVGEECVADGELAMLLSKKPEVPSLFHKALFCPNTQQSLLERNTIQVLFGADCFGAR
eukprot:448227-Rhodomonas_salina.1